MHTTSPSESALENSVRVNFVQPDGVVKTVMARPGDTLLEVAHEHDIDLEGSCGGVLACSTCHGIIDPAHYQMLTPATTDEEDMLDLAFNLTPHSRLCCCITVTKELDDITVTIPSQTRNLNIKKL